MGGALGAAMTGVHHLALVLPLMGYVVGAGDMLGEGVKKAHCSCRLSFTTVWRETLEGSNIGEMARKTSFAE